MLRNKLGPRKTEQHDLARRPAIAPLTIASMLAPACSRSLRHWQQPVSPPSAMTPSTTSSYNYATMPSDFVSTSPSAISSLTLPGIQPPTLPSIRHFDKHRRSEAMPWRRLMQVDDIGQMMLVVT
jgi:hypothetical protein